MRTKEHKTSEWKTYWIQSAKKITDLYLYMSHHQGEKENPEIFHRGIKQANWVASIFVVATPVVGKHALKL